MSCLLAIMYCHFQMEDLATSSLTFPSSPNSSSCFLHPLPLPPTPIFLQLNDGKLLQKTRQVCSCFFYQFSWSVPSFFFFNTVYILYELIAMFLDWVVDVFYLLLLYIYTHTHIYIYIYIYKVYNVLFIKLVKFGPIFFIELQSPTFF